MPGEPETSPVASKVCRLFFHLFPSFAPFISTERLSISLRRLPPTIFPPNRKKRDSEAPRVCAYARARARVYNSRIKLFRFLATNRGEDEAGCISVSPRLRNFPTRRALAACGASRSAKKNLNLPFALGSALSERIFGPSERERTPASEEALTVSRAAYRIGTVQASERANAPGSTGAGAPSPPLFAPLSIHLSASPYSLTNARSLARSQDAPWGGEQGGRGEQSMRACRFLLFGIFFVSLFLGHSRERALDRGPVLSLIFQ